MAWRTATQKTVIKAWQDRRPMTVITRKIEISISLPSEGLCIGHLSSDISISKPYPHVKEEAEGESAVKELNTCTYEILWWIRTVTI